MQEAVPGWGQLRPLGAREIKACYYQLIVQEYFNVCNSLNLSLYF